MPDSVPPTDDAIPELLAGRPAPDSGATPPPHGAPAAAVVAVILLLAALLVGGMLLFTDRGARHPAAGTPTAPRVAAAVLTMSGAMWSTWPTGSTPLFQVPIHPALLRGLAVAADGSFWIGHHDGYLLHYSATGMRLGTLTLPAPIGGVSTLKMRGAEFWVLDQSRPAAAVYRVGADGRLLAQYPMSELMGQGLADFQLGAGDQVLIQRDLGTPVAQLANPNGKLDPKAVFGIPQAGRAYGVYVSTDDGSGYIFVSPGGEATIPVSKTLTDLHILQVAADQSVYLVAEEQIHQPAGFYFYPTVFHYTFAGKLLGRARLPLTMRYGEVAHRITLGPDGALYLLVDTPGGTEVARVATLPPPTPLPDYGPPTGGVLPAAGLPAPTPVWDLAALVTQSAAIGEVLAGDERDEDLPGVGRWQTRPLIARHWVKPPPAYQEGTFRVMSLPGGSYSGIYAPLLPPGHGDYLVFLQPLDSANQIYTLTGGAAGMFTVRDGQIVDAGIPAYKGWSVDALAGEIQRTLTPGPAAAPTSPPPPTVPPPAAAVPPSVTPGPPPSAGGPAPSPPPTFPEPSPTTQATRSAAAVPATPTAAATAAPASPTLRPAPAAAPPSATRPATATPTASPSATPRPTDPAVPPTATHTPATATTMTPSATSTSLPRLPTKTPPSATSTPLLRLPTKAPPGPPATPPAAPTASATLAATAPPAPPAPPTKAPPGPRPATTPTASATATPTQVVFVRESDAGFAPALVTISADMVGRVAVK